MLENSAITGKMEWGKVNSSLFYHRLYMRFKSAQKEDGGGENNGLLSNSGKECALPGDTAELRNTSLHREFPARINLSLFFSFAKIYKISISWWCQRQISVPFRSVYLVQAVQETREEDVCWCCWLCTCSCLCASRLIQMKPFHKANVVWLLNAQPQCTFQGLTSEYWTSWLEHTFLSYSPKESHALRQLYQMNQSTVHEDYQFGSVLSPNEVLNHTLGELDCSEQEWSLWSKFCRRLLRVAYNPLEAGNQIILFVGELSRLNIFKASKLFLSYPESY